jgi:2-polyprenyl-6-hydroxyphenyl methylase/3-demethylubiquinone-9 3-methyltransferase
MLRLLFSSPPNQAAVNETYTRLRQEYALNALRNHFNKREDDPAPLYNTNLLDVGCGTSPINSFLSLSGANVTAVDPDQQCLERAREQSQKLGTPVEFIHDRVENLVRTNTRYDIILCLDVLEYVENLPRFLWTLGKLLKPEGVLVFSAINRNWKAWVLHIFLSAIIFKRTPLGARRYKRFYQPEHLRTLLAANGFHVVTVQGLIFDEQSERWRLTQKPDTRYLGTAVPL